MRLQVFGDMSSGTGEARGVIMTAPDNKAIEIYKTRILHVIYMRLNLGFSV
jgi:hypothetical protein